MTQFKQLMKFKRSQLNMAISDCFGEDGAEWHDKEDLVSDIISFGHADDLIEYLACD